MKYNTVSIHKYVIILLAIISCIALSSTGIAYDLEQKVQKFTLDNGLRVLIVERHLSPTVSLYISHKAGAVDEESGKTGTAHLLEHLLFKGTPSIGTTNFAEERKVLKKIRDTGAALDSEIMKRDRTSDSKIEELRSELATLEQEAKRWIIENEIDRIYTENGGVDLNASTGYDLTTYHVSLPRNRIELWARIESDRLTNPVFREFYTERNVIMEERRQSIESDPDRKLMEQFLATAFMVHPYRRPVIGWMSDIPFLSIDYVKNFFLKHYAPNNTVIAVVGDVVPSEFLNIIEKYFGGIPRQEVSIRRIEDEPEQRGERRIKFVADANPQLFIGYHKPTLPSYDDYVFDIIDTILSGGRTSRLYKILVKEKGIAQSVQSINGLPGARYSNLFIISAVPRHPHTNEELENVVYKELERLKLEPVSEQEIEKARNQLKADFVRRLSSNAGLASMLSYFEAVAGDYRYITDFFTVMDGITAEDIMSAAQKYFISENRTVAELARKENDTRE
jgi:predicted Zn-dependent peptidase